MANTTGKKIKDIAIIGGCASLIYLTIGDISYRLYVTGLIRTNKIGIKRQSVLFFDYNFFCILMHEPVGTVINHTVKLFLVFVLWLFCGTFSHHIGNKFAV